MDIQFIEGNNFKIKCKNSIITTSPMSVGDKNIYGPGEYEIAGVSVRGFKTKEKQNIFLIEVDKLSILFLNDFNGKLESDLVDEFGDVDVVLALNAESVKEANSLDPYFIITTNDDLVKDLGYEPEKTTKFVVKREDILENQSTKVVLITTK